VEFAHPASGQALRVEAPLAPDLQAFLDRLQQPDDVAMA
jgi:hypothetical protein